MIICKTTEKPFQSVTAAKLFSLLSLCLLMSSIINCRVLADVSDSAAVTPALSASASFASSASLASSSAAAAIQYTPVNRVVYAEGFSYEEIPLHILNRIAGISYPVGCPVSLSELRYLKLRYIDFSGLPQEGEMICSRAIAGDLVEIFYNLYQAGYQIERIRLVDEYAGDDTLSMLSNNTSCFNFRVVEGTTSISRHGYGMAVDVNPFYNPYVTYPGGQVRISPPGSEPFADRSAAFPHKIGPGDMAYEQFIAHGFTWGGNWKSCKDYQHFQK